ncbi:hypothetical protein B4U80_08412 [Leptotrombidium deliense]|uniref:IPT/TIG domain-containing protein n=1 Tax=Leptotrombidium deliense TaxID=299467 RepID=A0A443SJN2_9ACAR|nr:hypothetical protein B4U80_08412 [Leptotrombidium deliense]
MESNEDSASDSLSPNKNCNYLQTIHSFSTLNLSNALNEKRDSQSVELKIVRQPSDFHRARYLTEGIRCALTDKTNISFPTVRLNGFSKSAVRVLCYVGDPDSKSKAHPFYRICKVSVKNSNHISEVNFNGTTAVEFYLKPENDMQFLVNCVGIVKQRLFEIKTKEKHFKGTAVSSAGKSSSCTLVFECKHPLKDNVLRVTSDVITCKQFMLEPEISRISSNASNIFGGKELFIFGKNFSKDSKVIFKFGKSWKKVVEPQKDYMHKTHLICCVPTFDEKIDFSTINMIEAQICVFSNGKLSNSKSFHYFV